MFLDGYSICLYIEVSRKDELTVFSSRLRLHYGRSIIWMVLLFSKEEVASGAARGLANKQYARIDRVDLDIIIGQNQIRVALHISPKNSNHTPIYYSLLIQYNAKLVASPRNKWPPSSQPHPFLSTSSSEYSCFTSAEDSLLQVLLQISHALRSIAFPVKDDVTVFGNRLEVCAVFIQAGY